MERRRVIQSTFVGLAGIVRLLMWASEDTESEPTVHVCSGYDDQQTFRFSLASQERAYVLLNYTDNIRLSYIVQTKKNRQIDISIIEHGGAVTGADADYTRYPNLSYTRRSNVSDSQTILAGGGQYAMMFSNPAENSPGLFGGTSDAQITCSFVASNPETTKSSVQS